MLIVIKTLTNCKPNSLAHSYFQKYPLYCHLIVNTPSSIGTFSNKTIVLEIKLNSVYSKDFFIIN